MMRSHLTLLLILSVALASTQAGLVITGTTVSAGLVRKEGVKLALNPACHIVDQMYAGDEVRTVEQVASPADCHKECINEPNQACSYWTWISKAAAASSSDLEKCILHGSQATASASPASYSGPRAC